MFNAPIQAVPGNITITAMSIATNFTTPVVESATYASERARVQTVANITRTVQGWAYSISCALAIILSNIVRFSFTPCELDIFHYTHICMIAQLAGVKPTMCCENARSHHSPFSRFPPRSMFITPRSHHSSLLVQCSARAPRSVLSPNSSFSSFHQFPRSPRSLLTLPALPFPAPRSLITPRSPLLVQRSSLPASRSPLLVPPLSQYSSPSSFRAVPQVSSPLPYINNENRE